MLFKNKKLIATQTHNNKMNFYKHKKNIISLRHKRKMCDFVIITHTSDKMFYLYLPEASFKQVFACKQKIFIFEYMQTNLDLNQI